MTRGQDVKIKYKELGPALIDEVLDQKTFVKNPEHQTYVFRKRFDDDWDYAPTMAQWNRTADDQPKSVEQRIALRLLRQNVADVVIGPPNRRLAYIEELRDWMAPGANALGWTWDFWCEMLGHEPSYMRRKWIPFLEKCEAKAVALIPSYVRAINGHEMILAKRDKAHWRCRKCGSDGLGEAIAKECDK